MVYNGGADQGCAASARVVSPGAATVRLEPATPARPRACTGDPGEAPPPPEA